MAKEGKGGSKARIHIVRGVCIGVVCAIALISAIFGTGGGTLSSMGIGAVAYLCPLGALESMLGGYAFIPRALIALAFVVVLALLVGRSFCAWVCPVPPLRSFFGTKKAKKAEAEEIEAAAKESAQRYADGTEPERKGKVDLDSRHVVLCGTLGVTAIFGFPVFCLVCPIGLTFAIMIGLVRLIGFNEPSFSILLFAAILVIELVFLRKWCSKICPLGALLSLLGKLNRTLRPHADKDKCLRSSQGQSCGACAAVCPQLIDPQSDLGEVSVSECTRCGKCSEVCPAQAISFPFIPKKADSKQEEKEAASAE